jgi:hypothetical protein
MHELRANVLHALSSFFFLFLFFYFFIFLFFIIIIFYFIFHIAFLYSKLCVQLEFIEIFVPFFPKKI